MFATILLLPGNNSVLFTRVQPNNVSSSEFTPADRPRETTTKPTLASHTRFMTFYPFEDLDLIAPRPLLFVTGDRAHSREFSEEAYRRAPGPKRLIVVPDANHVDLYDRVDRIPFDAIADFFRQAFAQ